MGRAPAARLTVAAFEAVLFDCDGVLVDSELITNRVQREVLGIGGVPVQNGGNEAVATGAARSALAEFGADERGEIVYLRCHGAGCS